MKFDMLEFLTKLKVGLIWFTAGFGLASIMCMYTFVSYNLYKADPDNFEENLNNLNNNITHSLKSNFINITSQYCAEFANATHIRIDFPNKTYYFNNISVSEDVLKQSCEVD